MAAIAPAESIEPPAAQFVREDRLLSDVVSANPIKEKVFDLDELEREMLAMPQAECPVAHYFGPGIYVREVTLPAGAYCLGHAQRNAQLNIMLTGSVAMVGEDGGVSVLKAPMMYVGKPGRKIGYVLEKCVWQNIYATEETNIETLEEMIVEKSPGWREVRGIQDDLKKLEALT